MDEPAKKFALRMLPYGVGVVTAVAPGQGAAAGVTVHWMTQTSLAPPMIAVALPVGHDVLTLIHATKRFALNLLGHEDKAEAFAFRRPTAEQPPYTGESLAGWGVSWGRHATLMLHNAVSVLECRMLAVLEAGDHYPVIAEVIDAHVRLPPHNRPDKMILSLSDLGPTSFYGG